MKKSTTTNYLLIDLGNTCIKVGLYHNGKVTNNTIAYGHVDFSKLLAKFKNKKIKKAVFISSASKPQQEKLIKAVKSITNNIYVISCKDFAKFIDRSNIKKDVVIGSDILLTAFYISRQYKKVASICLGTVFYLIVMNNNRFVSVEFIPNTMFGLDQISKITSIPQKEVPELFNKKSGLNTSDAFAAGARNMMEGYLDLIAKRYKINPKHIFVAGGDLYKYKTLSHKYNFISWLSLKAIALLIETKKI